MRPRWFAIKKPEPKWAGKKVTFRRRSGESVQFVAFRRLFNMNINEPGTRAKADKQRKKSAHAFIMARILRECVESGKDEAKIRSLIVSSSWTALGLWVSFDMVSAVRCRNEPSRTLKSHSKGQVIFCFLRLFLFRESGARPELLLHLKKCHKMVSGKQSKQVKNKVLRPRMCPKCCAKWLKINNLVVRSSVRPPAFIVAISFCQASAENQKWHSKSNFNLRFNVNVLLHV